MTEGRYDALIGEDRFEPPAEFVVQSIERPGWLTHEVAIVAPHGFTARRGLRSLHPMPLPGDEEIAIRAGERFVLRLPRWNAVPGRRIPMAEIEGDPAFFGRWTLVPPG